MPATKRTPSLVAQIRRRRKEGMAWAMIANEIGVTDITARSWVDPKFRRRIRAKARRSYKRRTA